MRLNAEYSSRHRRSLPLVRLPTSRDNTSDRTSLESPCVSDIQVEGVAGHLVGVGYVDDIAAAGQPHAAPDTNQSLADAVV